jgi:retron-type reverse transcriptase
VGPEECHPLFYRGWAPSSRSEEGNQLKRMGAREPFGVGGPFEVGSVWVPRSAGVDKTTLDGIDLDFIQRTSASLKGGTFRFTPARRILIPKPNKPGEFRPLGIASPRQKIVQKAIELILTTIYEHIFLDCSYGFRPGRGCHSALKRIQLQNASVFSWAIEGDISQFFDTIPHHVILRLLSRVIDCPMTLKLIRQSLEVGYVVFDSGKHTAQVAGMPQGSILSPILSNIVLHELDRYVTDKLGKEFNVCSRRRTNTVYKKISREGQQDKEIRKKPLHMHAADGAPLQTEALIGPHTTKPYRDPPSVLQRGGPLSTQ